MSSVVKQIDDSCEVIVINDGSTDNTLSIINTIVKQNNDKTIIVIDQKHGGVSKARNTGLEVATGEYISFLDGDDIWCDDYYHTIKSKLNTTADLIEFDAFRFHDRSTPNKEKQKLHIALFNHNGKNKYHQRKAIFSNCKWYVWARVYKKTLFNGLEFPENQRFEDLFVAPIIYLKANEILSINKVLVGYRHNAKSITKTLRTSDIDDTHSAFKYWYDWIDINGTKVDYLLLSLTVLTACRFIKVLNQDVNSKDFTLTKNIRSFIKGKLTVQAIVSGYKYLPYLYFPALMAMLSNLKAKMNLDD